MYRLEGTWPTLSVVIATHNAERTIGRCLQSIRAQQYPAECVRIIVVDGASRDRTVALCRAYGVEILAVPAGRQTAEYNKGVGVRASSGEFLLLLDHDNVLPHPQWLLRMLEPLRKHPAVVGVQPLRFHYDRSLSLLDRYCALFGCLDPVVYALRKSDHLPWFEKENIRFGRVRDEGSYLLVEIDPERIPTLGANGFLVRRELLLQHADVGEDFFHIDVNADLIRRGFRTYAFTKDTILHLTGYRNVRGFLQRRRLFVEQFVIQAGAKRRYRVYRSERDFGRLVLFVCSSLTLVRPTFEAARGFLAVPDPAWFLHPVLSIALLWVYAWVMLRAGARHLGSLLTGFFTGGK